MPLTFLKNQVRKKSLEVRYGVICKAVVDYELLHVYQNYKAFSIFLFKMNAQAESNE